MNFFDEDPFSGFGFEHFEQSPNNQRPAYQEMQMIARYMIAGIPLPLQRPRYYNGNVVDSQKKEKQVHMAELQRQHKLLFDDNQEPFEGPLYLSAIFYLPIPRNLSYKKKIDRNGHSHIYKPDLSNLVKYIEDVSNTVIIKDDCQIAMISARKQYDDSPRTEFILYRINE